MDFTKINNDGEGIEKVPQMVLDMLAEIGLDYNYSSTCVRTADDAGKTTFEVGIKDAGENMNEAPHLTHDYSFMIDAMEKFKDGKDEAADEGFVRLMNDVPEVSRVTNDVRRDPISRAETNAEMCLFSVRDLESEAQTWGFEGIAFLNPSVGTVKRYTQVYPKSSVPIYITEVDSEYVRRISGLCSSLKLAPPNCTTVLKLDMKRVYYMGYRADKVFQYNSERLQKGIPVLEHVGFVPNLLAMACANVEILSYSEFDERFVYLRKSEEITVDMQEHVSMLKADVLTYDFSKLKQYKRSQGILHDLVSSLAWKVEVPVIKARPIPVGILTPKFTGPLDKRHDGIYVRGQCLVDRRGIREKKNWESPYDLASHRYMTGIYHGAIYDAGRVVRVDTLEDYAKKLSQKHQPFKRGGPDLDGMTRAFETITNDVLIGGTYDDGRTSYVESDTGDKWLRENRNGSIKKGKKKFSIDVVSQYVIGVESAIQYTGERLEMYGVKYVDMTEGNLEVNGLKMSSEEVEFGKYD